MTIKGGAPGPKSAEIPPEIRDMVQQAMPQIQAACREKSLRLVRVRSVSTQVVAGVNYFVDLDAVDATGHTVAVSATIWRKADGTVQVTQCLSSASQ
jgi:Cystatin domain